MKHFVLDTNVIIDFLTDRKPFSTESAKLFSLAERGKVKLYVTAVSYNNLYYVLKKLLSHKETMKVLRELSELLHTIDTPKEAIALALKSDFKDFEDAIQNFSALAFSKIDGFVTRNTKDYKSSETVIMTPEQTLAFLKNQL
jgi:predicted nucleic acid-binding protein